MIRLTRINEEAFVLNAELIRTVEARPDTYVTLLDGERLIVSEPVDEVVRRALEYRRNIRLLPGDD